MRDRTSPCIRPMFPIRKCFLSSAAAPPGHRQWPRSRHGNVGVVRRLSDRSLSGPQVWWDRTHGLISSATLCVRSGSIQDCVRQSVIGAMRRMPGKAGVGRRSFTKGVVVVVAVSAVRGVTARFAITRGAGNSHLRAARPVRGVAARSGTVPPQVSGSNVYAAEGVGLLSRLVRRDSRLVYVPNSLSRTADVISRRRLRIVRSFPVATRPHPGSTCS